MEKAYVGFSFGDDLAIKFQNEAEHPMRGRVGRPHVENHLLSEEIFCSGLVVRGCLGRGGGSIGSLVNRCGGGLAHRWKTTGIRPERGCSRKDFVKFFTKSGGLGGSLSISRSRDDTGGFPLPGHYLRDPKYCHGIVPLRE